MLNILINCLILLGIIVTIWLIAVAFIFGGLIVAASVGKVIEIFTDDKNKKT